MKLEDKLTTLRKEKELSQQDVAEMLNVSRQTISRWEAGSSVPSVDNLKALGLIYEVPLDHLLHDDAPRPVCCGQETESAAPPATGKSAERGENTVSTGTASKTARGRTWERRTVWILAVLLGISLVINGVLAVIVYNYKANELSFDDLEKEQLEQSEIDGMINIPFGW